MRHCKTILNLPRTPCWAIVSRQIQGNTRMPETKTVAIVKCSAYSAGVEGATERLLAQLGGMKSFVAAGQSVLIKPNLLTDRTPAQAVTTHPEVVRAIIRLVRSAGGEPMVGDSPASVTRLDTLWDKTGMRKVCEEEKTPLLNFEKEGSRLFDIDGLSVGIARAVLDADVVINVPKVKTHVLTTLTGAVKNMYGAVPGFQKTYLHKMRPNPTDFGRLLAGIHDRIPPALSIADGIVGMEGSGPSGGKPVELGFLAASEDSYALDATLCRILGIRVSAVSYMDGYLKRRTPHGAAGEIRLSGVGPDDIAPRSFEAPHSLARLIPGWLAHPLGKLVWMRPFFTDRCVSCGRCVEACPVSAISMRKNHPPVLNPRACIECCCCHEICPEAAIRMTPSPFLKLIQRGRQP